MHIHTRSRTIRCHAFIRCPREWQQVRRRDNFTRSDSREVREQKRERSSPVRSPTIQTGKDPLTRSSILRDNESGSSAVSPQQYLLNPIKDSYVRHIAGNLGRKWKDLVRDGLRMSEVDVEEAQEKYPGNLRRQADSAISAWIQKSGRLATVGALIRALRSCQLNGLAEDVERFAREDAKFAIKKPAAVNRSVSDYKPKNVKKARKRLFSEPSIRTHHHHRVQRRHTIAGANQQEIEDLKKLKISILSSSGPDSIPKAMEDELCKCSIPFSAVTAVDSSLAKTEVLVVIIDGKKPLPDGFGSKIAQPFLDGTIQILTVLAEETAEVPLELSCTVIMRYYRPKVRKRFLKQFHQCLCKAAAEDACGPHTPTRKRSLMCNGVVSSRDVQEALRDADLDDPHFVLCVRSFRDHNRLREMFLKKPGEDVFHAMIVSVLASQLVMSIALAFCHSNFLLSLCSQGIFRLVLPVLCAYQLTHTLGVSHSEWDQWKAHIPVSRLQQVKALVVKVAGLDDEACKKLTTNNTMRHVCNRLESDLHRHLLINMCHCVNVTLLLFLFGAFNYEFYSSSDWPNWLLRFIYIFNILGIASVLFIIHVTLALLGFDRTIVEYHRQLTEQANLPGTTIHPLINSWNFFRTALMLLGWCLFSIELVSSYFVTPQADSQLMALFLVIAGVLNVLMACNNTNFLRLLVIWETVLAVIGLVWSFSIEVTPGLCYNFIFIGLVASRVIVLLFGIHRLSRNGHGGRSFPHYLIDYRSLIAAIVVGTFLWFLRLYAYI